jgi:hypothetical protein
MAHVSLCTNHVSFKPEAGREYEVKQTILPDGRCVVNVAEAGSDTPVPQTRFGEEYVWGDGWDPCPPKSARR